MRVGVFLTAVVAAAAFPVETAWAQTTPAVTSALPAWRPPAPAPVSPLDG